MSLRCGIVGLPNIGKSTIFNVLTKAEALSQNYPFCTIEPNVARALVPDQRFNNLVEYISPQKQVQTFTEFVDIAGLVEGANKGEGLGNQFLSHIRNTQAIVHVLRCFEDDNVVHVRGDVDPLADKEIIETELMLADLESLNQQIVKMEKKLKSVKKGGVEQAGLDLALKIQSHLEKGESLSNLEFTSKEKELAKPLQLLSLLPVIYVCNVDEESLKEGNIYTQKIKDWADKNNLPILYICGKMELELNALSIAEQQEYLNSLGLEERAMDRMIRASYSLLELITFFTAGPQEVRAWTIKKGSTAQESAGNIHTDISQGFIRAEVLAFDDFEKTHSMNKAKDLGLLRLEGRDYVVQDGDIMYFRFNV